MTYVRARTASGWPCLVDHPARKSLGFLQRVRRALLSTAFSCVVAPVFAVSLGEVQTDSRIGDILQVRIPLTAGADEGITSECIRLEGPRTDTGDDLPWLRAGRLRLSQSGGQQQLLITSLQSVHSPVIMLAVRIDCNATLRREYTLLLNPPTANEVAPAGTALAVAPPGGNIWRVARGESLRAIARALFPTDRALQSRYVALLRQRNNDKLQGTSDASPLPPGTELTVPDAGELNTLPTPSTRLLPASSLPVRKAPPAASAQHIDETPPSAPSRRAARGAARQRLVLGGDERSSLQLDTGLAGRKELSEQERDKLRGELQLIATLDDKIATQLELSEKLRQLEALQQQLQSDVKMLEDRIHTQQTTLQEKGVVADLRVPQLPAASSSASADTLASAEAALKAFRWQSWLLPIGAVLALVLLFAGWRRYRDNRSFAEAIQVTVPVDEQDQDQAPQSADDLFEPLSEEDIWPDAATIKRPAGANTGTDLPGMSDLGPPSVLHIDEEVEEHNSAVELAEIMMSFGRVHGAAQTLADFIRTNPKQAVKPWVKLLEVYKAANMRPEFDALTSQLNKTFNVQAVTWDDFDVALGAPESLEQIEHVSSRICETWGKRDCQAYLHSLLRDNRQGTRQGFPLAMIDEILLLLAILESQLGAYKQDAGPAPQTVSEPSPHTMTASGGPKTPPAPPSPLPELSMTSSWRPKSKEERSALDFDIGTTDFDLGLDTDDLTRTMHINLDDLPEEIAKSEPSSRKPEDV